MMQDPRKGADWELVWSRVATTLGDHLAAGRAHLVTQEWVRLSVVLALQSAGVAPSRMALDVPTPGLRDGVADLVLDGVDSAVVDLRYTRDALGTVRDIQTLGILVEDFLRLALAAAGRRWVIRVLNVRTTVHLRSAAERRGLALPLAAGERLVLGPQVLDWLPATARGSLGGVARLLPESVACAGSWPIADDLALYAFEVRVIGGSTGPSAAGGQGGDGAGAASGGASESPPGSARAEVVEAMRALSTRGQVEVTVAEVLAEMGDRGSRFAEPTVTRLLTTHMCVDVKGRGIASYDDVELASAGRYRLRG